jgi:transcription initiation factor TFIIE subunit alpha
LSDDLILKIVETLAGEGGRRIVEVLLNSQSGKSDEEIAQELNLRINDVRKTLYELSKHGFVAYIRVTKGDSRWHNYYWYTDKNMLKQSIDRRINEVLRILNERLAYEESQTFYICPNDLIRYTFDEAFENNFRCIQCGSELIEADNTKTVQYLKNLIKALSIFQNT